MVIYVFGNPDLKNDSLALKLTKPLKALCPNDQFIVKDPNEDWEASAELVVIDVAQGIDKVTVFDDLTSFKDAPRITMHDFDALMNLKLLLKIGKLKKVIVIALPQNYKGTLSALANSVKRVLNQLASSDEAT